MSLTPSAPSRPRRGSRRRSTCGASPAGTGPAEEEPEESDGPTITVNGKEIQAEGSSVTVGGVTIITGGSPDMEETGTLIWTDPDTNTTFFLEGALDRFDLRDMAVRTEETEPQLSPPTKRAQSITGTAGGGK